MWGGVIGGISGGVFSEVSAAVGGELSGAIVGGAAAGVTGGGLSSAYYGTNISEGMLKGAAFGAIGGAVFGSIAQKFPTWGWERIGATTIAGGTMSEITGGDFLSGAAFSFAASCSAYAYGKIVRYEPKWEKGGAAVQKGRYEYPVNNANNFGTQDGPLDKNGLWNEGGMLSRAANQIPGLNATAGMHDVFQVSSDMLGGTLARNILNVPGMFPAAALSYAALMTDMRASIIYYSVSGK